MRILKVATTLCFVAGLFALFFWPKVLGSANSHFVGLKAMMGIISLAYFGFVCLLFIMAAIFAWLMIRRTKLEYFESQQEVLHDLIEQSLQDHAKKP